MIPFVVISMLNNLCSYGLVEEMKGTLNHCAYSCERVISVVQISSYYGTPLLGNAQKASCFKFLIVCYYVLCYYYCVEEKVTCLYGLYLYHFGFCAIVIKLDDL